MITGILIGVGLAVVIGGGVALYFGAQALKDFWNSF